MLTGENWVCVQRESTRLIYYMHGAAAVGVGDLKVYPRVALRRYRKTLHREDAKKGKVRRIGMWRVG